jgi:DNA topoisomerase-3
MHETFFTRSYPDLADLLRVHKRIPDEGMDRETLLSIRGLDAEVAEACLDKLWGLGAVVLDFDDVVRVGPAKGWAEAYQKQRTHREGQLDVIFEFARSGGCRMQGLVAYFGDRSLQKPCGHCDHCAPTTTVARRMRTPDSRDKRVLTAIADALSTTRAVSIGKVFREEIEPRQDLAVTRREFEVLIDALERAEVISTSQEIWDKGTEQVRYRTATLLVHGRSGEWLGDVQLDATTDGVVSTSNKAARSAKTAKTAVLRKAAAGPVDGKLLAELKAWRMARSRIEGVPAFRILTDAVLTALVAARPRTEAELLQIPGIGPRLAQKYGADLLAELARG